MKKSSKSISIILISCISLFFATNAWCALTTEQEDALVKKVAAALVAKVNVVMPKEEDLRREINREINFIFPNNIIARLPDRDLYRAVMAASNDLIGVFTFHRVRDAYSELGERISQIIVNEGSENYTRSYFEASTNIISDITMEFMVASAVRHVRLVGIENTPFRGMGEDVINRLSLSSEDVDIDTVLVTVAEVRRRARVRVRTDRERLLAEGEVDGITFSGLTRREQPGSNSTGTASNSFEIGIGEGGDDLQEEEQEEDPSPGIFALICPFWGWGHK